jgi:NAD+ synthase
MRWIYVNRRNDMKTIEERIQNIQKSFQQEGYKDALIGVSGGVDSATSLALTVRAIGKTHVYPVLLPYGSLNDEATNDALLVINWLGIPKKNVQTVDIQPMVDASVAVMDKNMDDGRKGNIMARMRMVVLYDLSKKMHELVVGTENKTEHLLGYYTRFGDEASDIEPIGDVYKTQVYELARHLGVPTKILNKPPTAGLWQGQTDEGEFGFTYKQADEVLSLHVDQHLSRRAIIQRGYAPKLVGRIWWWLDKGNFKDRMPLGRSIASF